MALENRMVFSGTLAQPREVYPKFLKFYSRKFLFKFDSSPRISGMFGSMESAHSVTFYLFI